MRRAVLVAAALCLSAAPAFAQGAGQQQMTPGAQKQTGQMQGQQAGEWKGLSVYSSDNQMIGEVARVEEAAGQPKTLHVKTGQELGIGERTIEIDASKAQKSGNQVNLQMTADEVKQLPAGGAGQKQ